MDKRDFYRELMDEFSFDKEKIYNNAKNGLLSRKDKIRSSIKTPIYIGMTAAVAAVVVTVGTLAASQFGGHGAGPLPSEESYAALSSEQQRIKDGLNAVRENENSKNPVDVLVTFSRPLSPAEAQSVLLENADGSVPVKALFMDNGTKVNGTDNVGAVFAGGSGSGKVTGAVIRCAGYLMTAFQDNSLVLAVELYTPENGFEPIVPPITDSTPEHTSSESTPESTDNTDNSMTESTGSVDSSDTPPDTSDTGNSTESGGDVVQPPENDLYEIVNYISAIDERPENTFGSPSVYDVPQTLDWISAVLPEGVTLPGDMERFSCNTDNIEARNAYFLNDNVFYVRTDNDIRLYTITDGTAALTALTPCGDAKVFWISENGGSMLALGIDNKIYNIDANSGTISEINIAEAVGSGEIAEIAYNENSQILALNVCEDGMYYLRVYQNGYDSSALKTLFSSEKKFALAGAEGNTVFYAQYSAGDLCIYKVSSGESPFCAATIDGEYLISRNAAFTHAVLQGDHVTMIFDPISFKVVFSSGADVDFGVSGHSFRSGGKYFTIIDGEGASSGGVSVISKIDFKNSFSQYYTAVTENGTVYIVEGSYNERAKNDYLTFEIPSENASVEVRGALDAAVKLQNALTRGICADCGIDSTEKLIQTMAAIFTENSAAELVKRCEIGGEENLEYTGGGLVNINLSETVLTVSEETEGIVNGTLYIYAGSFDGKTAYFTCPVKLIKTENGYAVDCIIE